MKRVYTLVFLVSLVFLNPFGLFAQEVQTPPPPVGNEALSPASNVQDSGVSELCVKGLKAYKAEKYSQAMNFYKEAAKQGSAKAEFNIGYLYDYGWGVAENEQEALKWYLMAAAQGYADAEYNIGILYEKGEGVTQDYQEAMKWFLKAAAQGNNEAEFKIGYYYENGYGVTQDLKEAIEWFKKAARDGNEDAINWFKSIDLKNDKVHSPSNAFHFQDSSGNKYDYYPVVYLLLQGNDTVGPFIGGSFTIIKKVNKNGWLVEASESDISIKKTFCLKIPKSWDVQTIVQNPGGFGVSSQIVSRTGIPPFRALNCLNLIVHVTDKFMKFTNSLDDTEDSIRVLELKAIVAQPCM